MEGRYSIIATLILFFCTVGAVKDVKRENEAGKAPVFNELKRLEPLDWLRTALVVLGSLVPMLHTRRTWLVCLVLSSFFIGFMAFGLPTKFLNNVANVKVDPVHKVGIQISGILNIGAALLYYLLSDSRDPHVSTSILLTHGITHVLMVVSIIMDYKIFHANFKPQVLSFSLVGIALIAFGCMVYSFHGSQFGKGNFDLRNRLTRHLLVDSILMLLLAFSGIMFGELQLKQITMKGFRVDGIHFHTMRYNSIMLLMAGLHGLMALGYKYESDQRAVLLGRIVKSSLVWVLQFVYVWQYNVVEISAFYFPTALHLAVIGNLACGYFGFGGIKYKRT